MTETEEKKEAVSNGQDWAIIPFDEAEDEAEDEARWTRLIEETDKLIEEAAKLEAIHGPLLSENKLNDLKLKEEQPEDFPF